MLLSVLHCRRRPYFPLLTVFRCFHIPAQNNPLCLAVSSPSLMVLSKSQNVISHGGYIIFLFFIFFLNSAHVHRSTLALKAFSGTDAHCRRRNENILKYSDMLKCTCTYSTYRTVITREDSYCTIYLLGVSRDFSPGSVERWHSLPVCLSQI